MRIRYSVVGDRVRLRLDARVEDESRVWKTFARFGVRVESEQVEGSLTWRKVIPRDAFPKLQRACRMMRFTLAAEPGSEVAPERSGVREAYEEARPLDPNPLVRAARDDPVGAERPLAEARATLVTWMRANPTFLSEARRDLEALDGALKQAQTYIREQKAHIEAEEARQLSTALRGVSADDAYAAHAALKRLTDAVKRVEPDAYAGPAVPEKYRLTLDDPERIPHFMGKLRPYQVDGVRFLLSRGLNAILADDMGLGKTVMAIAAVEAADERALVVAPANVIYNWADEVQRFTDESACVYHQQKFRGPKDARFMVMTYDALRNVPDDSELLKDRPVLILDEAHYVRNAQTLRSRLVRALPQKRRLLLTGTPLVNGIEDYYELLRQVDPARWGSRAAFRDTWLVDPALFNKYAQVRNITANLLQRAARDVMMRRRKDQVLPDLPPRTVGVRHHELTPKDASVYRQLEARAEEVFRKPPSDVAVFAALHGLRKHLAATRITAAEERVRELLEADESVVVYSEYLEPLKKLHRALGKEVSALLIGETPPRERQTLARTFGRDGGPRVLLAQMEAGGIGLNFTAARHVLFIHFGWTPAVHAQAMDRVHRIGQDRPVIVEFFVTPDTIDERMVRILLRKEEDQNLVLADAGDFMNRNEVMRILAEDAAKRVEEEKKVAGLTE